MTTMNSHRQELLAIAAVSARHPVWSEAYGDEDRTRMRLEVEQDARAAGVPDRQIDQVRVLGMLFMDWERVGEARDLDAAVRAGLRWCAAVEFVRYRQMILVGAVIETEFLRWQPPAGRPWHMSRMHPSVIQHERNLAAVRSLIAVTTDLAEPSTDQARALVSTLTTDRDKILRALSQTLWECPGRLDEIWAEEHCHPRIERHGTHVASTLLDTPADRGVHFQATADLLAAARGRLAELRETALSEVFAGWAAPHPATTTEPGPAETIGGSPPPPASPHATEEPSL
ncbi:hypothetical protein IU469_30030 [Nocardia puris]|uniref:hypothetical protein n=1 Tax=Nocardia puris TaxID=208602 RepID=UPI001893DB3F|nr:hypothetical protein [Nocardia puris]MBF6369919.1 hypothetical protein [Nocardia puris]